MHFAAESLRGFDRCSPTARVVVLLYFGSLQMDERVQQIDRIQTLVRKVRGGDFAVRGAVHQGEGAVG